MKFEKNKILNGFRGPGTTLDNKREGGREGDQLLQLQCLWSSQVEWISWVSAGQASPLCGLLVRLSALPQRATEERQQTGRRQKRENYHIRNISKLGLQLLNIFRFEHSTDYVMSCHVMTGAGANPCCLRVKAGYLTGQVASSSQSTDYPIN